MKNLIIFKCELKPRFSGHGITFQQMHNLHNKIHSFYSNTVQLVVYKFSPFSNTISV